jgi:photosystem II stability/assembly factor-like uncharacterized protein
MRRIALFLATCLLAGCTMTGSKPVPPNPPMPTPPSTTDPVAGQVTKPPVGAKSLTTIQFVDTQHGWAGGDGTLLATTDGGRTWTSQYTGASKVQSLDFTDSLHGWVATGDGFMMTIDGGKTWTPLKERPEAIDFITADVGWMRSGGHLYQTSDSGRTWSERKALDGFKSFCASAPETLLAAIGDSVMQSRDGGKSWAPVFKAPGEGDPNSWQGTIHCRGAAAYVLLTGGAAMGSQAYVTFRSTDDGKSWAPVLASHYPTVNVEQWIDAYSGPFDLVNADTAFFLGSCAPCLGFGTSSTTRTADGGRTWHHDVIAFLRQVTALSFVDAQHGWILAEVPGGTAILATTDGGSTWSPQYPTDRRTPARAVAMVNDQVGFALGSRGDAGALLRTPDGGRSWDVVTHLPMDAGQFSANVPALTLSFSDEQHGWAANPGGTLRQTADGGAHWQGVKLPSGMNGVLTVSFATPLVGCVQTSADDQRLRFFSTTDGGSNWQDASDVGGVVACAGALAGQTWLLTAPPGSKENWYVLATRTDGTAWVNLGNEELVATRDAGKSWQRFSWPSDYRLGTQSLSFGTPDHGVAVTIDGQFLRTADGGRSWQ